MSEDPRVARSGIVRESLHDQPIPDLMRQLATETSTLVRQELDLAKAELAQKGKNAGIGVGMFGGAGLVSFLALACITLFFVEGLHALGVPLWLAALVVGIVYGVIAGVLALVGKRRIAKAVPPAPDQTVQSVKEDVEWAKIQAKSGRR